MHPYRYFTKIRDRQGGGTVITTLLYDITYGGKVSFVILVYGNFYYFIKYHNSNYIQ